MEECLFWLLKEEIVRWKLLLLFEKLSRVVSVRSCKDRNHDERCCKAAKEEL